MAKKECRLQQVSNEAFDRAERAEDDLKQARNQDSLQMYQAIYEQPILH